MKNKDSENQRRKNANTKSGRIMLFSKCAVCGSKKNIKEQEASGLLSSLGIKTP